VNPLSTQTAADAPGVVVTGSSSGLGRSTALALTAAGYCVFAGVRHSSDGGALLAAAALHRGRGRLTPVIIEATDAESIAAAAREVSAAVGPRGLTGLINNAGIGVFGPVETVSIDDLRRIYEVNVFGQVAAIQAFLPLLRAGRGRVVNIGSIGDRLSLPFGAPLTSSKSALASITDSLRIELRPWGIHVVLIEPASIRTATVDKAESDAQRVLDELSPRHRALYGPSFAAMMSRLLAKERDGSSPEVVAAVIVRALRAHRPRARYLVGKGHRPMVLAARWAPDRILDLLRIKMFDLPTTFGEFGSAREEAHHSD